MIGNMTNNYQQITESVLKQNWTFLFVITLVLLIVKNTHA